MTRLMLALLALAGVGLMAWADEKKDDKALDDTLAANLALQCRLKVL